MSHNHPLFYTVLIETVLWKFSPVITYPLPKEERVNVPGTIILISNSSPKYIHRFPANYSIKLHRLSDS